MSQCVTVLVVSQLWFSVCFLCWSCFVVRFKLFFVALAAFPPQLPLPPAMDGQPANTEFGLRAGEHILRGGKLQHPVLITGLRLALDGTAFVALAKESGPLTRFLTGKSTAKKPLSKTLVFETLLQTRNMVLDQLLKAVQAGGVGVVPLEDAPADDQLAALDLGDDDDSGPQASHVKKKGRTPSKAVLLPQLPETIVVNYPGSDWEVEVLTEKANRAVHMKFTVENMDSLFALVAEDLSSGAVKRKRPSQGQTRPSRAHGSQHIITRCGAQLRNNKQQQTTNNIMMIRIRTTRSNNTQQT
jgi:hypothetical protein